MRVLQGQHHWNELINVEPITERTVVPICHRTEQVFLQYKNNEFRLVKLNWAERALRKLGLYNSTHLKTIEQSLGALHEKGLRSAFYEQDTQQVYDYFCSKSPNLRASRF